MDFMIMEFQIALHVRFIVAHVNHQILVYHVQEHIGYNGQSSKIIACNLN